MLLRERERERERDRETSERIFFLWSQDIIYTPPITMYDGGKAHYDFYHLSPEASMQYLEKERVSALSEGMGYSYVYVGLVYVCSLQ